MNKENGFLILSHKKYSEKLATTIRLKKCMMINFNLKHRYMPSSTIESNNFKRIYNKKTAEIRCYKAIIRLISRHI